MVVNQTEKFILKALHYTAVRYGPLKSNNFP
jgi:hypothetical protein